MTLTAMVATEDMVAMEAMGMVVMEAMAETMAGMEATEAM